MLVLPVQLVTGVQGDVDAELAYALETKGRGVGWVGAEEIEEILARSPSVDARTRGLPVAPFLRAEVRRVGDPLYGQLRRMSALVDAEVVLLPVAATFEPNASSPGSGPRVRLTMALVAPRTGQVVWFGVEEGGEYAQSDPRGLASAAERVARTLLWYVDP